MALPEYNGFSLQDDNFITTDIEYRTWPTRNLSTSKIARRPGMKLISEEFGEKNIRMRGFIKGTNASDLQQKIDALYVQLQRPSRLLQVEAQRFYTATVSSVSVGDPHYAQDIVPYELEFLCPDPFAYGSTLSAVMTVTSGTIVQNFSVAISGSYFAEPSLVYTTPAGTGDTTTSGVKILHQQTGEYVIWSGSDSTVYIPYGDTFTSDYQTYQLLYSTTQTNQAGVFSRWEPGDNTFEVTFGGNTVGGTLTITYAPRYL